METPKNLNIQNLNVRKATRGDLPSIFEIYNYYVSHSTVTFDTETKNERDQGKWFEARQTNYPVLVAEESGSILGWACLSPWSDKLAYAKTTEVSVYVSNSWKGKGIGKLLYKRLIDEAKNQNFHTLLARIAGAHEASLALHKAFGFFEVGIMREAGFKFGNWIDVHIYQLLF